MRLLSQLGAHPSRLAPPATASSSFFPFRRALLPFPANARRGHGHSRSASYPSFFRLPSRITLFLATAALTILLYFLFSDGRITSNSERWSWKGPSWRERLLYGPGGNPNANARTEAKTSNEDDLPDLLPIREDPHPNPHIPLPRESVFTDPWPSDPKISQTWLSSERLAQMGIDVPDWPAQGTGIGSKPIKRPNRLNNSSMVQWQDFWRQSWYRPARLEELPEWTMAATAGASAPVMAGGGAGRDEGDKESEGGRKEEDESTSKVDESKLPGYRIQAPSFYESEEDISIRRARREWVKKAFMHAWTGYKARAWGHDEVKPVTGRWSNPFNGWGATIVDGLSTLLVMNLTDEYRLARTHVRQVDFTTVLGESSAYGRREDKLTVPVFETIIRYLGGLLSAYDLTEGKDHLMLARAEELANWLIGAFECVHLFCARPWRLPV